MSALNFNKVALAGRLTADVELKQTTSGLSVCTFNLAVNRRHTQNAGEQTADFIACTAWRQTAEFISKYFKKGSALMITGSIQTRSWQDQQGQKRYATEVVVDEAYFVDSKSEPQNSPASAPYIPDAYLSVPTAAKPVGENYAGPAPNFEGGNDDDQLPF